MIAVGGLALLADNFITLRVKIFVKVDDVAIGRSGRGAGTMPPLAARAGPFGYRRRQERSQPRLLPRHVRRGLGDPPAHLLAHVPERHHLLGRALAHSVTNGREREPRAVSRLPLVRQREPSPRGLEFGDALGDGEPQPGLDLGAPPFELGDLESGRSAVPAAGDVAGEAQAHGQGVEPVGVEP